MTAADNQIYKTQYSKTMHVFANHTKCESIIRPDTKTSVHNISI